jgi:hypothetical protein
MGNSNEQKRAEWMSLVAEADAAWKRGDMDEWERLRPLVDAAFDAAGGMEGCGVHLALSPELFNPSCRPEDN